MTFTVTDNGAELAAAVGALGDRLDRALLAEAFGAGLSALQAEIQRSTASRLAKDPTGALLRSWEVEVRPVGDRVVEGGVTSALPYARIHDEGGIVRPKRGRFLAIPQRGVARGLMPRHDLTPMRAIPTRKGGYLLIDVASGRVRYVLVREVRIPATHYVRLAVEAASDDARGAFVAHLTAALERAAEESTKS